MQKILLVDLFKGVAIIMIIIVHSAQIYNLPDFVKSITNFGQMGCQMFFLMSAFTLCYSCNNNLKGLKNRILKILPGYWSVVIINFIISIIIIPLFNIEISHTSSSVIDYIINLLFIHGLFPTTANNNVVLGGWFIGTLVIFYVLFPLVYRLYFQIGRMRYIIFPLVCFFISFGLIAMLWYYDDIFECSNNSFAYFSFINQFPAFVLGLSLFDIVNNRINIRFSLLKGLMLLIASMIIFHSSNTFAYVIMPFVFGMAILYLYIGFKDIKINHSNLFIRLILLFNKYSFAIYLTHSFIVYYVMRVVLKILKLTVNVTNPIMQYIILLPITFLLVYYLGKIFNRYQQYISVKLIRQ